MVEWRIGKADTGEHPKLYDMKNIKFYVTIAIIAVVGVIVAKQIPVVKNYL